MLNEKTGIEYYSGVKSILIKNSKVASPLKNLEFKTDILIENGLIKKTGASIDAAGFHYENDGDFIGLSQDGKTAVINAGKYITASSFMDMHVHLREPGEEYKEDISSGVKAALSGGITSLCCMPNTIPAIDSEYLVDFIKTKSKILGFDIYPAAAMTIGLEGQCMTDMGLLKTAGAAALSDDGKCVQDSKLMYEIMKYSAYHDIPLILHEEDYSFTGSGLMHEGYYSARLGLDGISPLAEELVISRDISLAEKTGAKVHITHLSSKKSVDIIKNAKEKGIKVTCDVTPHHLFFNDSSLLKYNTNLKVNPPIRGEEDQAALIKGLKDGVIDAIASDHAPHTENDKNTTFRLAANGTIGMETLFKASFTKLCIKENMGICDLLRLLTYAPFKILGMGAPSVEAGKSADLVIIDTKKSGVFDERDIMSKSRNSAFKGSNLNGQIICTINKGKISYLNYDRG